MIEGNQCIEWKRHISDENIMRAVEFLLSLENNAVPELERHRAYRLIKRLEEALEAYHARTQKNYWILFAEETRRGLLESSLRQLRLYAISLATILLPETQLLLLDYLVNPEAKLPVISFKDPEEV